MIQSVALLTKLFKWPPVIFFTSEHIRYSVKHTGGDNYLPRSYALLAFLSSSDPGLMMTGKLAEKEMGGWGGGRDTTESVFQMRHSSMEVVSFCSELCRPEREGREILEKQEEWATRGAIGAWRAALNCFAHSCMHTFAWAHALTHTYSREHTHTWKHSHTRFQFKDFGPICTCMPANQGLSTGRKPGVSQGEIFCDGNLDGRRRKTKLGTGHPRDDILYTWDNTH